MSWFGEPVGRREFLRGAAIGGTGLLLGPVIAACSQGEKTTKTQTFRNIPPDQLSANLNFTSVNYNPEKVKGFLQEFQKAYPKVQADYTVEPSQTIQTKLVTVFSGGGAKPNLCYVGDDFFREFIAARWIQPLDGFPGAKEVIADFFPHTYKALAWDGKLYGLPYYSSVNIFAYSEPVLARAGIPGPPSNLDELKNQCLEIKRAGIIDFPLLLSLKQETFGGDFAFWSLLFASGGNMFDGVEPIFDRSGSAAEQVVAWLTAAMNDWHILDPGSIQTSTDDTYLIIGSGKKAFSDLLDLYLLYANTSKDVSKPGTTKAMPVPGLQSKSLGTMGWTRAYSIPTNAADIEASWALAMFVGGKPLAGEFKDTYHAAASWFKTDGLGYGYHPLDNDQALIDSAKSWVDIVKLRSIRDSAKARDNILAPWYFDWANTLMIQVQEAIAKTVTPHQAMVELRKKTDSLRSRFGD